MLDESLDDLQRRYINALFVATINNKDVCVRPTEYWEDTRGGPKFANVEDIKIGKRSKINISLVNLRELYPPRGLYNWVSSNYPPALPIKTVVVFFTRSPYRQWNHGVSPHTSVTSTLAADWLNYGFGNKWKNQNPVNSWEFLGGLFNPWYPESIEAAFHFLKTNICVALNKEWAICLSPLTDNVLLFRKLRAIGYITPTKITIAEGIFAQELSDFLNRTNQQLKIEIM